MKRFFPVFAIFCLSLPFFFSCSNGDDSSEKPVSYTIDKATWDSTMKGLAFITSETSNFTVKKYDTYGEPAVEVTMKKEGLKLERVGDYRYGHFFWLFTESGEKSKSYVCYNEKYNDWLYRYFDSKYKEAIYQIDPFDSDVIEELYEIFVENLESSYPEFETLTFENNTYSYILPIDEDDYEAIRYEFTFEDGKLASWKVWDVYDMEDYDTGEPVRRESLLTYYTFSDWGTTKVSLPETHALEEMDFEELTDFLFVVGYNFGRENRYSWDIGYYENPAWLKIIYSALIYYDSTAEEEFYKIKTEEKIREHIIRDLIERVIIQYADVEDLSEGITDPRIIYRGRFTGGNHYYIEIIEEQVFDQAAGTAPIFKLLIKESLSD